MKRLQLAAGLLAVGLLAFWARPAVAQGIGSYYPNVGSSYQSGMPSTPRISPYLDLFRRDSGPLDNYHTFVQPQKELSETLRRQEAALQRQNAAVHSLGQQVTRLQRGDGMRATGTGSVFMNLSHYYPLSRAAMHR
jgi:hypothetical protein